MPVQILRLMPGEPVENSQKSLPCLTQVGQPLLQLEILQVVGANSERKEYHRCECKARQLDQFAHCAT
jgi:hypothetical protein